MKTISILISFCLLLSFSNLYAGEADVIKVDLKKLNNRTYRFNVTVLHADTGWDHYANKWDVIGEDGTIFGTRILHHPHVDEQPFTRSLSDVEIPVNVKSVKIRAHDSVHEYGGKIVTLQLSE